VSFSVNRYLGQAAKKSFWNTYDHLGGCILLNLLWSLLSLPWLCVSILLLSTGWAQIADGRMLMGLMVVVVGVQQLLVTPVSAALWAVTARWVHYQKAGGRDFFPALRKFFGRSLSLWLLFTLSALLLALNVAFYQRLPGKLGLLGAFISGLMGWAYLFLCLVQMYALPILVQEELPVISCLRRSALVVLDNVWYSLCLALLACSLLFVGLISVAGFLCIGVALSGVITNTGLRQIMRRYQPERRETKPRTWAEIQEAQSGGEEEPRGWRDLWRPWKD
jgi:uncharacterized membrane protein YesL